MKITFKASDFKDNEYCNRNDCAMARAMKRINKNVFKVGGYEWRDKFYNLHKFTESGKKLSNRLSRLWSDKKWKPSKRVNPFLGKSYHV